MVNPPGKAPGCELDERELKAVKFCLDYAGDPFGAPNHLYMVIIAKLWKRLTALLEMWEALDGKQPQ